MRLPSEVLNVVSGLLYGNGLITLVNGKLWGAIPLIAGTFIACVAWYRLGQRHGAAEFARQQLLDKINANS